MSTSAGSSQRVDGIVLDFDGVIADSMTLQRQAWREAIREVGGDGLSVGPAAKATLLANFDSGRAGEEIFAGVDATPGTRAALRTSKNALWAKRQPTVTAVRGAHDGLTKLAGRCPLAIASTKRTAASMAPGHIYRQ